MSLSQSAYILDRSQKRTAFGRNESIGAEWNSPKAKSPWEHPQIRSSSPRPRSLSRPDNTPLIDSVESPKNSRGSSFSRVHGNTKPQEPAFMSTLPAKRPVRLAQHSHAPRPWTVSSAPGKREIEALTNVYNRVWATDGCSHGRWNRHNKKEYYEKQDSEMLSKKPHDEKFAKGANKKFWTNLNGDGIEMGGYEKLETIPPRGKSQGGTQGLHLKHSLYKGKFENIKHSKVICKSPNNFEGTGSTSGRGASFYAIDDRKPFDQRVYGHCKALRHENDKDCFQAGFEIHRPKNTLSCPELGVDFVNR